MTAEKQKHNITAPSPIPMSAPVLGEIEKKWVMKCLDSGYVSSVGPLIEEFEKTFAEFVGARYAVATVSGTAAIHVALKTVGFSQGDLALLPDLTFVASLNPALYCGAEPVFCDVLRETWTLDPAITRHICANPAGKKPGAIIPVHLYGCACDMQAILEAAHEFNVPVIEDATEALGTYINGKHVGTFGDIGCFSFNGNKMITTGGGGMLVTDSRKIAEHARHLVNQARPDPAYYIHDEPGFNYRMTNLTASLGLAQMERLPGLIRRKREIAAFYEKAFTGHPSIQLHPEPEGVSNCFWLYSIVLQDGIDRDTMIEKLAKDGIPLRRFFHPLHKQPYVNGKVWISADGKPALSDSGNSDLLAGHGLNLPSSPEMTNEQQEFVMTKILEHFAGMEGKKP